MLPLRILALLVILLAVQGLCKPTKSNEDENYEDDTPLEEEEEDEEEEETDNSNVADKPPQILSMPKSIRAKAGSSVLLPCQVINAENYAITWMRDNEYLYFGGQSYIQDNKRIVKLSNNSLMIHNVSVNDTSDNYKCSVLGESNLVVIHRLLVDPEKTPSQHSHKSVIHVSPSRRVEANQGSSVLLGCRTSIEPQPEIKWFIENKKVDDYDPDVTVDGNHLTIKNVNRSHSGRYQCLAEDGSQTPAMEAITVIVHYVPEIEVKRNVVHSGTGIESEMTCIVSAYPEAIIKWYKGDKEIVQKKGIMMHHGIMKGNRTKHVLKILHTSSRDFGDYKCSAENAIGKDSKLITLTGASSQPKLISAEITDDDMAVILKWCLESYSPINEYRLEYRRIGDKSWNVIKPEVKNGKGNQFIVEYPIKGLQPGSYQAILAARNAFGWSPLSEPYVFTGESPPEMARKEGNAAVQIRPPGVLLALILVVLSCAFPSL